MFHLNASKGVVEGRKGKPMFCPKKMTKRILIALIACVVLLFGLCALANADMVPVKMDISVSPSSMSAPRSIEVTVKVTNIGDDDLPGSVTLYGPNGKVVTDFGDGGSTTLKIGASHSDKISWAVTEAQLNNGKLTFQLKYPVYNDEGVLVKNTLSVTASIKKSNPEPKVTIKRTLSNNMAEKGDKVTITYDIENIGDATIEGIKFKEHKDIASKTQSIAKLEPGQRGQAEFVVTMGTKDLTSQGTITYKAEGSNKTHEEKVESTKIVFGAPSLTAKLEASNKQVNVDQTTILKLTLENTGNVDYENIRVTDATLGELFTNQQVPAKDKLELSKEITVRENGIYVFAVEATDASGNTVTISTGKVEITSIDPNKVMALQVTAASNRDVIYEQPGIVKFTITVENVGQVDAKNVPVTCAGKTLYTFAEIKAGESQTFVRDVSATIAGKFQFVASAKDQLENTVTFESNIIQISYTQPTPEPTQAPTLPAPTLNQLPIPTDAGVPEIMWTAQKILNVAAIVLLVLLIVLIGLLVLATVRRAADKRTSDKAYDHLERTSRRDYAKENKNPQKDEGEATEAEATEEKVDLFSVDIPEEDESAEDDPAEESAPEEDISAEPAKEEPETKASEPVSAMNHGRARRSTKKADTDIQA